MRIYIKMEKQITTESKLSEVREYLKQNYSSGCSCPACGQHVELYRRGLNSSMARALIIIFRVHRKLGFDKGIKMNQEIANMGIPANNIEYAKLAYWGLLEQSTDEEGKLSSGYWKITDKGCRFVQNVKMTIPKYVFIYNNKVQGYGKSNLNIIAALGDNYNYNKLLNGE